MATADICFTGITHDTCIRFHERVSITKALLVMAAVVMGMRKISEATIKLRSEQAMASLIFSGGLYVIAFVFAANFQYRLHKHCKCAAFSDCRFMITYFCEYLFSPTTFGNLWTKRCMLEQTTWNEKKTHSKGATFIWKYIQPAHA